MWLLDQIASRYGQRPSAILGIEDEWAAWQFDVTAWKAGQETPGQSGQAKSFGALGGRARTVKVPETGVW